MTEYKKCEPEKYCHVLLERLGATTGRGLSFMQLTNFKTMKPIRSFIRYRIRAKDQGTVLNFCPWCGGRVREEDKDESKMVEVKIGKL